MKSFKIQVHVPEDILFALEFSQDRTSRRILELLTIDLFNQDRITCEKAAEILEVGRYDFLHLLGEQGKAFFHYSTEELSEIFEIAS